MKTAYKRFFSPTPAFWKKVQKMGASMLVLGTGIMTIPGIPAFMKSFAGALCIAGPAVGFVAQFASTNGAELDAVSENT